MYVYLLLLSLACVAIHGTSSDLNGQERDSNLVRNKRQGYYHYYYPGYNNNPYYWYNYRTTRRPYYYYRTTTTTTRRPVVITTKKPTTGTGGFSKVCPCTTKSLPLRIKRQDFDHDLTDSFRIVGGIKTEPHAYPQMALVVYGGNQMCGGTVLNERYILTAAHCVQGNTDVTKYDITVGAYDLNDLESNRKTVAVESVIKNNDFNTRTFENDIALLKLKDPLVFNVDVQPTCLALENTKSFAGEEGTAVGWGRTTETGSSSRVLREVTVPILTNTKCGSSYAGLYTIYSSMICAGEEAGGKDSCAGDSGGPLFADKLQVGVTSFGLGCARREKPGVYSRITAFVSWIEDNVDLETCKVYSDDA